MNLTVTIVYRVQISELGILLAYKCFSIVCPLMVSFVIYEIEIEIWTSFLVTLYKISMSIDKCNGPFLLRKLQIVN